MQIHQVKIKGKKAKKKIGRGGKRGTYSGRGMKGQKSRSGSKRDPLFEGGRSSLVERMKKLRGFKSYRSKKFNISLAQLDKKFKDGEIVDMKNLIKVRLASRVEVKNGVKILGDGKMTKKLTIDKNISLSNSAKVAIEKAGGKVEVETGGKKIKDDKKE